VAAMEAVPVALDYDVSAVELMDDEVFRLAAESDGYAEYAEPIPEGTEAALMLEYDSELHDDFEAAIAATNERFVENGKAFDVLEAYTDEAQADLWDLRKAAIPLLMSLEGDPKPYPFIEDATVPPAELAEYVMKFEEVLEDHDTSAAYFAHAGSGTLHIRPILNLKDERDIDKMHSITDDVTDLVLEHHGAFSGEHGDGMARTEFNPKMYGDDLWEAFKHVKTAFDPAWDMHPGNVVYRDGPEDVGPDSERGVGADNRENLRYGPAYESLEPQTALDFEDEGGFSHLVELCNGCGTCRQTDENVMCPTYRASEEEVQTTRGRANLLRSAISGDLPEEEIHSDRFQEEVLDLCVGCKGCKSDCPTGVDFAKLKAEVKHQHHEEEGASLRERLFANIDAASRLGSAMAPLSNWATKIPGARKVMQSVLGIAPDRELPPFRRETLRDWFESRGGAAIPERKADRKVLLFPDTYTNYSYPAAGKAAVEVLEAAGVHVAIPDDLAPSGRAAFSTGMLDQARERAATNVEELADPVAAGWDVVFVEPSDAVMFQDEYLDLLDGGEVERVAESAYGVLEYLDAHRLDEVLPVEDRSPGAGGTLTYHGHCNQKATNRDHHAVGVMRRVGYDVDPVDSTCCGMAGSFGYHDEHYELSKAIGRLLFEKVDDSPGERVVAPGGSCRSQLGDRDSASEIPDHPIEAVADRL
jgi:Fe-S oxidoreductase